MVVLLTDRRVAARRSVWEQATLRRRRPAASSPIDPATSQYPARLEDGQFDRRPRVVRRCPARRPAGDPDHHRPDTESRRPSASLSHFADERQASARRDRPRWVTRRRRRHQLAGGERSRLASEATARHDRRRRTRVRRRSTSSPTCSRGSTPIRTTAAICRSASSPDRRRTPSSPTSSGSRRPRRQPAGTVRTVHRHRGDDPIEGSGGRGLQRRVLRHVQRTSSSSDGRLQSFLLNGVAIDDRLAAPSKAIEFGAGARSASSAPSSGSPSTSWRSSSPSIQPARTLTVSWDEVRLRRPVGGRASPSICSPRPTRLTSPPAVEHAAVVLQFPTADARWRAWC